MHKEVSLGSFWGDLPIVQRLHFPTLIAELCSFKFNSGEEFGEKCPG